MTWIDWLIVILVNGSIIGYGFYLAKGTHTSSELFLAARSLPWWAVGLSMFATNVDNADLVGVTGKTFSQGIHVISVYAIGSALGGILAAYLIVPKICQRGFYTNAEYLEARYSPSARILSALIQIQYRTSMLGLMIWSTHIVLTQLVELSSGWAWFSIVVLVVFSGWYTAWGGLKSVVWTDSAQGIVMIVAALVIFGTIWSEVGGWTGLEDKLVAIDDKMQAELASGTQAEQQPPKSDLLHIGRFHGDHGNLSPYFVVIGWTIVGCGYWTVNHTQTMRLMGSRSLTDMKYAAVFGVFLSLPIMVISAFLGVFAHGIENLPEWSKPDDLYPLLANQFLGPGFKGIVVAGVVAAVVSTFDSMGSALSAIFTRDVYARLIAPDKPDEHYVRVGRWATAGVLLIGFAYLPFIARQAQMLDAFTTLIPVFVTPLLTIYLAGVLLPVHRKSGIIGLGVGSLYGVIALLDRKLLEVPLLPTWFTEQWVAFSWSILFTFAPMVIVTLLLGKEDLAADEKWIERGWLQRSREELPPFAEEDPSAARRANFFAAALLLFCGWVTLVWLW